MSKARRKAYHPKPISRIGGMGAIVKRRESEVMSQPLEGERQSAVVIAYHAAIDAMTGGYAEEYHFDTICYALNVGQILAEHGLGQEYLSLIEPAIYAMQRARARYLAHGKFGLDGPGLVAITAVAGLHEEQMRIATHAELMSAVDEMHKRVAANPQQRRAA